MKMLLTMLLLVPVQAFTAPVNINSADAATIAEALPGIGPKKAEEIVKYRTEHGQFKSVQELENVNGIGSKTLKAIEKDIVIEQAVEQSGTKPPAENPPPVQLQNNNH